MRVRSNLSTKISVKLNFDNFIVDARFDCFLSYFLLSKALIQIERKV